VTEHLLNCEAVCLLSVQQRGTTMPGIVDAQAGAVFLAFAGFAALGALAGAAFLAVGFLVAAAFVGATVAAGAPTVAFVVVLVVSVVLFMVWVLFLRAIRAPHESLCGRGQSSAADWNSPIPVPD